MAERKATMTDRERVEALLRREKPDRVPIWPFAYAGFATVYTGTSIADAYNNPKVAYEAQKKTCQDFGWVFTPMLGYAAYGGWEFGGEIKWPSGEFAQAPTVAKLPVEKPEDVWNLKTPDVPTAGIVPIVTEFMELAGKEQLDNEPYKFFCFMTGPFNTAGMIAGPDMLCKWVIKKPDVAHHLIRLATDHMKDLADYWADKFGLESSLAFTGEAIATGQLISAKQFEDFVLPYFQEAHQYILDRGYKTIYCHQCGEQNANLEHWAKLPYGDPGIISIGHEVELETAGKYFPNEVILGNLEPAIIQSCTPDEVYEATKKNVLDGMSKCPGGYVFSPGCELPPMAKVENVKAMSKAVEDYGWYD
jgi:uroporphyrinogen decarboxylase